MKWIEQLWYLKLDITLIICCFRILQDSLHILYCFWCFDCYFFIKANSWPNVFYMVTKLMMRGLISCLEHQNSQADRLRIAMTQWDIFDSFTWTLVLCETMKMIFKYEISQKLSLISIQVLGINFVIERKPLKVKACLSEQSHQCKINFFYYDQ